MKKVLIVLMIAGGFLSAATAQDLKQILASHSGAMGYDKLSEIATWRISGENVRGKGGVPFTIWIKGQKIRYESEMRGNKIVQVFDGYQGWFISPRSGEIRAMPKSLVQRLKERARMGGYLARWEKMLPYLSLEGSKDIKINKQKVPVYKIVLEIPDISTDTYYIDKKSYLLLREADQTSYNGRQLKRKVEYGDYRNIDGVMVAFERKSMMEGATMQGQAPQGRPGGGKGMGGKGMGGGRGAGGGGRYGGGAGGPGSAASQGGGKTEMRFDRVECNVPLDDKLFTKESLR